MTENESKNKNKVFCLQNVNVSPYVSNKMGLSYLNWAFVVDSLKTLDPKSTYKVKQFPEINMKTGHLTARNVNYCEGVNGEGAYVTVTVIFRGASHTESLPCYDFKGRAVAKPDVMLVNKTIKRCYVKAAAMLTGLGISLYINGNPSGGNQNQSYSSNRSYANHRNNYSNYRRRSYGNSSVQSSYRNQPSSASNYSSSESTMSNKASKKQQNYINYLLHNTKSDGTKWYQWAYSNRSNLTGLSKDKAAKLIKLLIHLQNYQKKNTESNTGKVKQTTLIK